MAILCTRLLGSNSEYNAIDMTLTSENRHHVQAVEQVQQFFKSVNLSMFTLFEMMSCWSLIRFTPLFEQLPVLRLLAVLFYVLTAWALLAVMTGVVNEKMLAVRETLKEEE